MEKETKDKRSKPELPSISLPKNVKYISYGIDWILQTREGDDTLCTDPAGMANILMRSVQFAKDIGAGGRGENNGLYYYHQGVYKPGAKGLIAWGVIEILSHYFKLAEWRSALTEEVTRYILSVCPDLWTRPPIHTLNLLNGLLKWDKVKNTFDFLPHTPDHLTSVQLPIHYNPDAKCPGWDKFLKATLPEDVYHSRLIYHLVAWLITPHTEIQKILFLLGSGANGKSIFLDGLTAMIGEKNISNLTLQQIEHDKFAVAQLLGKLVNIYADINNERLKSTNMLKAITGGDTITGERKYGDMFSFVPFCRLVFSANEFPQSPDNSEGFYRRLMIIPFNASFVEDPEIGRRLKATLTSPSELSGVLNQALTCFEQVFEWGLPECPSTEHTKSEIRTIYDPFVKWVSQSIEPGEGRITKKELWESYNDAHSKFPMTQHAFSTKFSKLFPQYKVVMKKVDGIATRLYEGCQFKSLITLDEPTEKLIEDMPPEPITDQPPIDTTHLIINEETGEIFEDPEVTYKKELHPLAMHDVPDLEEYYNRLESEMEIEGNSWDTER